MKKESIIPYGDSFLKSYQITMGIWMNQDLYGVM